MRFQQLSQVRIIYEGIIKDFKGFLIVSLVKKWVKRGQRPERIEEFLGSNINIMDVYINKMG